MARIEHIALWVDDLDAVCAFYEDVFGARAGPRYANPSKGFESRFLCFESGARVEVMTTTRLSPMRHPAGAERMGLTHFAISLGFGERSTRNYRTAQSKGSHRPGWASPHR